MIEKIKRLEYILNCSPIELNDVLENINKYYYEKKELKRNKDGTPKLKNGELQYRIIHPSTGTLKNIQKLIKRRLLSKIELPCNIQGGVKKRDNLSNAKQHQGKRYHFCTDLQNFFPTINNKMIYRMFVSNSFSHDVSRILTMLTTYKGFLPQGTPTSTHIANIVFLPYDIQILKLCDINNIKYTRFVDDLSFSSQIDFQHVTFEILNILKSSPFKISNKKTFYKIGPSLITGIWAKNNVLDARKDQKDKLDDQNLTDAQRTGLKNYINRVKNY